MLEISRLHTIRHTHTHTHPVEALRTHGKPVAETATRTTNTRDEHPCPQWDSKARCRQYSGFRPTPLAEKLPGSSDNSILHPLYVAKSQNIRHTLFQNPTKLTPFSSIISPQIHSYFNELCPPGHKYQGAQYAVQPTYQHEINLYVISDSRTQK